jgi:hypothetical protein
MFWLLRRRRDQNGNPPPPLDTRSRGGAPIQKVACVILVLRRCGAERAPHTMRKKIEGENNNIHIDTNQQAHNISMTLRGKVTINVWGGVGWENLDIYESFHDSNLRRVSKRLRVRVAAPKMRKQRTIFQDVMGANSLTHHGEQGPLGMCIHIIIIL